MKKILSLMLAAALCLGLAACADKQGIYNAGTYEATAKGYGGDVTVKMVFEDTKIKSVEASGPSETSGVGSKAIDQLPAKIVEKQSSEVDKVAGATVTSNAIIEASRACIAKAKGEEGTTTTAKMAAGTYEGTAVGYKPGEPVKVTVTVTENAITAIVIDEANTSETLPLLWAVRDLMIPRMIEAQSVAVDSITGATVTSAAVKMATENALVKALEAAGSDKTAISVFKKAPEKTPSTETLEADVLVVGMGGSGTAAAVSAAEGGSKVLAIDKAGKYGGTSSLTTEGLFVNPPKFEEEHNGGKDYTDADVMLAAWLAYTEGDAKEDIVRLNIERSGEALDWLIYEHGYAFAEPKTGFTPTDVYLTKYQYLPNDIMYNKTTIATYFDGMYEDFAALGGTYLLETEATELIYDAATNTVTGVKAVNHVTGKEYTINAKAVILATGGFAGNAAMEEQYLKNDYFPIKGAWYQLGSKQNDGKMIASAISIGAGTYNIGMPPMVHMSGTPSWLTSFEVHPVEGVTAEIIGRPAVWSEGDLPANMVWSADSLAVDATGHRFTTEAAVSFLNPWIGGPKFYSIWSDTQVQKLVTEGFDTNRFGPAPAFLNYGYPIPEGTPVPNAMAVLDAAIEAGFVVKADTIEELAGKLGIDAATLKATVDTYNGYCEAGVDEQFGKDAALLDKVDGGPYYAVTGVSYCYSTCGGLDINADFQVLKTDGTTPIEGLYAVGTDCMGVLFTEKKPYVTYGGAAQGWAYTSGYLAGGVVADKLGIN
jgi:fumarate reductase flavoprotein subunit